VELTIDRVAEIDCVAVTGEGVWEFHCPMGEIW